MISKPKTGRLVNNKGKTAQCMAQATEVVIPNASQFIFLFMRAANIQTYLQLSCKKGIFNIVNKAGGRVSNGKAGCLAGSSN